MNSSDNKIKIIIGFIIYGQHTSRYLPFFLPALKSQTCQDFRAVVFNNGAAGDDNEKMVKEFFPEAEILSEGKNIGFAAAYNRMISWAREARAQYFLMVNPDLVLEPEALERLIGRLDGDGELGSVGPKILKWDFEKNIKTDIVDTYGIALKNGLRFFDVGQGRKDDKKFRYFPIVGPSGAAGLFRMSALEKVKEGDEYLDENMFMYKEDCDLDYRLYLIGQEAASVPEAVAYHDRTVFGAGTGDLSAVAARKNKSREARRWSFFGQQVIYWKYWHLQDFSGRLAIVWREIKTFVYVLLFERFLLSEYLVFWRKRDKIQRYR